MILWHDLNFWTAAGQLGIGVMAGMAIGLILKRMRRTSRTSARRDGRMCPRCGAPSLQRVHGATAQGALGVMSGHSDYVCTRCHWPAVPVPVKKIRFTARRSAKSAQVAVLDKPVLETLVLETPVLETPQRQVAEPAPIVEPAPTVKPAPAVERAAVIELDQSAVRPTPTPRDDSAQVKDAIYHSIALLNSGDVTARANCYLSEFTSFTVDGGPLHTSRFERRPAGPTSTFDLRSRDLRVYIYKDTAIATAYLVGTMTHANAAPTRVTGRSSWVLLRQNAEWKIAHSHLSPLNPEA